MSRTPKAPKPWTTWSGVNVTEEEVERMYESFRDPEVGMVRTGITLLVRLEDEVARCLCLSTRPLPRTKGKVRK